MSIKEARMSACKTVLEVAHFLGVSPQAIYQWERGESKPSASNLVKLANLYGCSAGKLLEKGDQK